VATIRSLLRDRVTLQVRSVDRVFLQAYVPKLMSEGLLVRFLLDRGFSIPSPALLGKIGQRYVRAIEQFARRNQIPVVHFEKRASKEAIARPYFERAEREGRFGVVLIGVAQERARVWAGWRHGGSDAHPHFAYGWQSRMPNHYYVYVRDREWGRAFVKACAYAPYPRWLYLNGHEWAKRQCEKAGIGYEGLDNGFRACADPEALAAICNRLSARHVWGFFRRWERILPSPFTDADRQRGYRHQLAFRQLELADTRVFDRPPAVRQWFEQALRDQLTLGRPDRASVVFGRKVIRTTPGRFLTRILSRDDAPGLDVHYKASKVKQYLKEGRALRTETTVNDSYDFGVGRTLTQANWQALLSIGQGVNDRLLEAQIDACPCAPAPEALERVVLRDPDATRRPALRFGDPRVHALLASLCCFQHLLGGITSRSLRPLVAASLPGYTPRQMSYDLRRLRQNGFLERIEGSNRYTLTPTGRRLAVFFAKTYARLVTPSLAELDPALPAEIATRSQLARAWRAYERALETRITDAALAA
jgi:hypothetical protein